MSEENRNDTARHAYHRKRADEEIKRAEGAVEPGARHAHRALAKLHRDRIEGTAPDLLIARE